MAGLGPATHDLPASDYRMVVDEEAFLSRKYRSGKGFSLLRSHNGVRRGFIPDFVLALHERTPVNRFRKGYFFGTDGMMRIGKKSDIRGCAVADSFRK
jgi:hypothetical protein